MENPRSISRFILITLIAVAVAAVAAKMFHAASW